MNLQEQIEAAAKIRDFIMHNAPQGRDGEPLAPYDGWVDRLDREVRKGKAWLESTVGGKK